MTIVLFGGNGWIGTELQKYLKDFIVAPSTIRCDERIQIEHYLDSVGTIKHIVCLIGRTHGNGFQNIDYLEQKGKLVENIRDNLYAPILLAIIAKERNIHYTYVGTGCIFEYDEMHPINGNGFKENEYGNFFGSSYSTVKNYTDRLMHEFDVLNVRLRMPITSDWNPRSFLTKIIGYSQICSMPNSVCVLSDLLPILVDLIIKKETGTIHLVNPGYITHNEILELYKEIICHNHTWTNITIKEQNELLLSSRSNTYLDTTKLAHYNIPSARESIIQCLQKMKITEFGIVIPTLITNNEQLNALIHQIEILHSYYPDTSIVIIDDYSTLSLNDYLGHYPFIKIILSYQKGLAELLPYDFLFKSHMFHKILFLSDKYFMKQKLDVSQVNSIKFIKYSNNHLTDWSIIEEPITDYNILHEIKTHDDKILDLMKKSYEETHPFYQYFKNIYFQKEKWVVCFSIMSVITINYLIRLQAVTNIMCLFPNIKTRRDRMAMESIFAIACLYTGDIDINDCSLHGIWKNMKFKENGHIYDDYCDWIPFSR